MEPQQRLLGSAENSRDPASALAEIEQKINGTLQRIGAVNIELAALYNANYQNFNAAYDRVQSSLAAINQIGINELRSCSQPLEQIEKITRGVLVLLRCNDLSWSAFRNLSREHFLESLTNFDILNDSKKRITELQPIIDEFQETGEDLRRFSITAFKLYIWISAVYQLCRALSQYNPIGQLRAEIDEKSQEIANLQNKVIEGRNKIQLLREQIENINGR